jgi:hypothetical protein
MKMESWHLPTILHGAKSQNVIILTAVKTLNLIYFYLFDFSLRYEKRDCGYVGTEFDDYIWT